VLPLRGSAPPCAILTAMATRLLIVDDHEGFRSFARTLFASEGFEVTGDVEDGEAALDAVEAQHPDAVLCDVQLPGIDGFEVARRLANTPDPPSVVLTSTRDASDYGLRLTGAQAKAFIPKQDLSGDALAALLAVA
jgi:DNA-binding NarL/FixJ family response regulator